ncbi:MAG: hypothetical protein QOJ02_3418 [Acidobacteriota bacterium]|jgi:hypothetical protein|nr:hypothetical protein [Acidobacteriota bacterium]
MIDLFFVSVAEVWNETTVTLARLNKAVAVRAEDLKLLSSLYLARFIVWRELHRRRKQEKVRP